VSCAELWTGCSLIGQLIVGQSLVLPLLACRIGMHRFVENLFIYKLKAINVVEIVGCNNKNNNNADFPFYYIPDLRIHLV
jgi:hypothetical protein